MNLPKVDLAELADSRSDQASNVVVAVKLTNNNGQCVCLWFVVVVLCLLLSSCVRLLSRLSPVV